MIVPVSNAVTFQGVTDKKPDAQQNQERFYDRVKNRDLWATGNDATTLRKACIKMAIAKERSRWTLSRGFSIRSLIAFKNRRNQLINYFNKNGETRATIIK